MMNRILWILLAFFAFVIGLYPALYFFLDRKFALLSQKSNEIITDTFWNVNFYIHIILGGLALLIGWTQFHTQFRNRNKKIHRNTGKVYIISVLLSSVSSLYLAFFATGGVLSALGFTCLGILWFYTTWSAYQSIRNQNILKHQQMMIYSYALCFSAVTLRLWLPILIVSFQDFVTAYTIVAWLCWVPNLIVAFVLAKRLKTA